MGLWWYHTAALAVMDVAEKEKGSWFSQSEGCHLLSPKPVICLHQVSEHLRYKYPTLLRRCQGADRLEEEAASLLTAHNTKIPPLQRAITGKRSETGAITSTQSQYIDAEESKRPPWSFQGLNEEVRGRTRERTRSVSSSGTVFSQLPFPQIDRPRSRF